MQPMAQGVQHPRPKPHELLAHIVLKRLATQAATGSSEPGALPSILQAGQLGQAGPAVEGGTGALDGGAVGHLGEAMGGSR